MLQSPFAVGHDDPGFAVRRIATLHLGLHLGDEGILARQQAGPDALLLGPVIPLAAAAPGRLIKETLHDSFWRPDIGFLGEHRADGGHALLVALLSPAEPDFASVGG